MEDPEYQEVLSEMRDILGHDPDSSEYREYVRKLMLHNVAAIEPVIYMFTSNPSVQILILHLSVLHYCVTFRIAPCVLGIIQHDM